MAEHRHPNEILKIIKSLKPKKSCTDDDINSIILKKIAEHISEPISCLVNKYITTGVVPDQNGQNLLYKTKAKDNLSNYRPISILPTISKILLDTNAYTISCKQVTTLIQTSMDFGMDTAPRMQVQN
jgi:hypothetical protein